MKAKRLFYSIFCFTMIFIFSISLSENKKCYRNEEIEDINIILIKDNGKTEENIIIEEQNNSINCNNIVFGNVSKKNLCIEFHEIVDGISVDIEASKHNLEVKEEIESIRHPNAPKNTRKSYMSYKAITKKSSDQYKLQQVAYTGTYGIRQVNGRFCVALGSAYTTTVGNYVDIILENGEVIECILADLKQNRHTDPTNRVAFDGSLLEFVVDTDYIINKVRITGDVSVACEEWKSMVSEVIVYDKVEEFK